MVASSYKDYDFRSQHEQHLGAFTARSGHKETSWSSNLQPGHLLLVLGVTQ
jgi:hypothetical protein